MRLVAQEKSSQSAARCVEGSGHAQTFLLMVGNISRQYVCLCCCSGGQKTMFCSCITIQSKDCLYEERHDTRQQTVDNKLEKVNSIQATVDGRH